MVNVSGDLATVRIHIEVYGDPSTDAPPIEQQPAIESRERDLAEILLERRENVAGVLRSRLRHTNDSLQVDVAIVRGSVEILAVISAVGLAIKSYAEFAESLDKATVLTKRYVGRLVGDVVGDATTVVSGTWQPGQAVERLAASAPAPEPPAVPVPYVGPPAYPLLRLLLPYAALACLTVIALVVAFRATR